METGRQAPVSHLISSGVPTIRGTKSNTPVEKGTKRGTGVKKLG
jgi:hypothetical protein